MKTRHMVASTMLAGVALGMTTGCMAVDTTGAPAAAAPAAVAVTAPVAATVQAASAVPTYDKLGFFTALDARDGRLWVFAEGSEDLAKFKADGRPARHVLRPGAGPLGLTLKSTESSTIIEYIATKPGFVVSLDARDERLWVFVEGSEDLAKFKAAGRPARHVLRPGAGPLGLTLKSTEAETIVDYIVARNGFHTELDKDGRLWVFRTGSPELVDFQAKGKPARHVVRPAAGPLGLTMKAVDADTLDAYQGAR